MLHKYCKVTCEIEAYLPLLPHLPLLLLNFPHFSPQEAPSSRQLTHSLGRYAGNLGSGWQLSALSLGPDEEGNVNH